ncbi:hypothetical protein FW800_23155 [Pseudomonas sp. 910_23]|uniref:hypothetical protein n=1 Tax=Pseudomonas sp. 910_23 TaxID=2604461 RepID=UPI004063DA95
MSHNQTIDGVLVLSAAVALVRSNEAPVKDAAIRELRALLDAPPRCPDCGYTEQDCREQMDHYLCGLPEPAPANKPAAQPHGDTVPVSAHWSDWSMVTLEIEGRHRTYVELGKPERPQGEPVYIQAVAVTRDNGEEGLSLEWLLEGGISEMEFPGMVLFAIPEANDLCDEGGSAEVYLTPPQVEKTAPVAVVMPERLVMTDGLHTYEYVTGHNDCIDKALGVKS